MVMMIVTIDAFLKDIFAMRLHSLSAALTTTALIAGAVIIGASSFGFPAQAQVYNEWSNPDASSGANTAANDARHNEMMGQLNDLIDQAERDRAADPKFLNDLRAIITGQKQAWAATIMKDDFMDGNYTENPEWRVVAGRWWVERGWGLRSALKTEEEAQTSSDQPPTNKLTGEEVFGAVLSTILKGTGQVQQKVEADNAGANVIAHDVRIANAFAVRMNVTSWVKGGRFEVSVYQGSDRDMGYVLAYEPEGVIEMLRVSSRGTSVIERAAGPFALENEKPHDIQWTRDPSGTMSVSLDGAAVFSVSDKGFRDPFDGIRLSGKGSDVIIKTIQIDAAQ